MSCKDTDAEEEGGHVKTEADWSDAATSQGTPGATGSLEEAKRGQKDHSPANTLFVTPGLRNCNEFLAS